jgi:hypothetical protein
VACHLPAISRKEERRAAVPAASMLPCQPARDAGTACGTGATFFAAPHRLATAAQGQGAGGGGGWACWLAVCCVRMDGALRTFHDAVKHTIARSAVDAGFEWRWRCIVYAVYGMFTINVHSRSA